MYIGQDTFRRKSRRNHNLTLRQPSMGRLGRTTGHGIAGNLCRHYPNWLLQIIVTLLFIANAINIGADLSAMADASKLLIGGPGFLNV